MIKKIMKFMGIYKESDINYYNFIVGNSVFLVFEISENYDIINNELLKCIFLVNNQFYWFKSFEEFENYFDYVNEYKKNTFIVIIG
jgi:hypothetical protein